MEDYFMVDIFSEDLINGVLKNVAPQNVIRINKNVRKAMGVTSPYTEAMGKAVGLLKENNKPSIDYSFERIKTVNFEPNVGRLVIRKVADYCPNGYNPKSFLAYCSVCCGIAEACYKLRRLSRVVSIGRALASVLTAYILTGQFQDKGGWKKLDVYSNDFNQLREREVRVKQAVKKPKEKVSKTESKELKSISDIVGNIVDEEVHAVEVAEEVTEDFKVTSKRKSSKKKKSKK